jgi:uncharacterized protein YbaR (Trm112 family)
MYLMQKYWARKPHNVVAEYIQNYSRPDEIVLDPFLGSGVTLIEAVRLKRKAIGFDLDPFSKLIAQVTVQENDLSRLKAEFDSVKSELEEKINSLYSAVCPRCKKQAIISYLVWSYIVDCPICRKRLVMAHARRPKGKRQNIYKCPFCRQDFSYANANIVGEEAISLDMWCPHCNRESKIDNPRLANGKVDLSKIWYPRVRFCYNGNRPFVTRRRASTIEELFTERNLYALALLFERISGVKDENSQRTLQFIFASTVPQASKMMIWTKVSGPSWKVPEYLIFPVHCEFNVWSRFQNRFRAILRGLENSKERLQRTLVGASSFEELSRGDYWLSQTNAIELGNLIPADSVDYIFTDPPYGGAIQYFELDLIRVAWMLGKQDGDLALSQWSTEEITINRGQGKNFEYYHKMLSAAFSQSFRVLKPGHYLTVTFHSTDIDVWNSIILAVRFAGFELEKIIYQPPAVRSAKASLQPYGSAVGDYYIRFRKPEHGKEPAPEQGDRNKYRTVVIETARRIIAERGEPTPFTFILNGIIPELDRQGVFFVDRRGSQGIEEVLRERMGIDFVFKPIVDPTGKETGQGWWFKDPSSISYLQLVPLSERVEKVVINILNSRLKVSYDEVLQEVFITFPNALTPNTQSVRVVLDEYAVRTPDEKWMLKPAFKKNVSQHDLLVKSLAQLGERLGFEVHADIEGYRKPSFPFETEDTDRVKEVDVIWYSGKEAIACFEVENTTGITEAIIRGGNINSKKILRVVVIPKERIRLLRRRIREPLLKENILKYGWRALTYEELEQYMSKHKRRAPNLDGLRKLMINLTDIRLEVQQSMQSFI